MAIPAPLSQSYAAYRHTDQCKIQEDGVSDRHGKDERKDAAVAFTYKARSQKDEERDKTYVCLRKKKRRRRKPRHPKWRTTRNVRVVPPPKTITEKQLQSRTLILAKDENDISEQIRHEISIHPQYHAHMGDNGAVIHDLSKYEDIFCLVSDLGKDMGLKDTHSLIKDMPECFVIATYASSQMEVYCFKPETFENSECACKALKEWLNANPYNHEELPEGFIKRERPDYENFGLKYLPSVMIALIKQMPPTAISTLCKGHIDDFKSLNWPTDRTRIEALKCLQYSSSKLGFSEGKFYTTLFSIPCIFWEFKENDEEKYVESAAIHCFGTYLSDLQEKDFDAAREAYDKLKRYATITVTDNFLK